MKNVEGITYSDSTLKLKTLLESKPFELTITALIIFNAIIMGMETNKTLNAQIGHILHALDQLLLMTFTVELAARLYVYKKRFFTDPWSIFDSTIIFIAWLPATGGLSLHFGGDGHEPVC